MTATFAQLAFNGAFFMMMNVFTVFALLSEEQSLRVVRMIDVRVKSNVAWLFPRCVNGHSANQPRPIRSVISQPVIRIGW
ncbi:MAG TPA: hypothetical protein VNR88_08390 [Hyphomicrobium sp.]|nr:hypothetical protein [Hyphomicrobium sp.]